MKLQSYQQMLAEYEISELDSDNKISRDEMLSIYQYSVILEGEYLEFDNLNKWIESNLEIRTPRFIFYGKISYNYGFAEYFFSDKLQVQEVSRVIPCIYTSYPASLSPDRPVRSNGYDNLIEYDPMDPKAIILR